MSKRIIGKLEEDSYTKDKERYHSDKKYLEGSRYDESVLGSSKLPISIPSERMMNWKMRKRIKTQGLILALCLNLEHIPNEASSFVGDREECWIYLDSILQKKDTYDLIAKTLNRQYGNQVRSTQGLRTKQLLDPTTGDIEAACEQMRNSSDKTVQSRVIFHYNGHGVPCPSPQGDIWVFNKHFDTYKPLFMYTLNNWLQSPTCYVMDCGHAGELLIKLNEINPYNTDEGKEVYFLGACDTDEEIPVHYSFPADMFTACITDPLRIYIKWLLHKRNLEPIGLNQHISIDDTIDEDFAYRLSGSFTDRDMPKGKLRMIFECITDSIAWEACDIDTYRSLFKTDEMVSSLFHNFFLAQRIMSFFNCHPVSRPPLPDMSTHHLWNTMDAVMEDFIHQLTISQRHYHLINEEGLRQEVEAQTEKEYFARPSRAPIRSFVSDTFVFKTNFFRNLLTELYTYVNLSRNLDEIPDCFPMLYILINSDEMTQYLPSEESINVIELLASFAERSVESVSSILVTVNFNSLKRMSFKVQRNHRAPLLRLWTCITAFDSRVHEDITQNLFAFLFSFLRTDAEPKPGNDDISRVLFLLTVACHQSEAARIKCRENGVQQVIRKYLKSDEWKLRCWACLLLYQLCWECNNLKEFIYFDAAMNDVLNLLSDSYPEVRTAAILLLQSFVGLSSTDKNGDTNNIHCYLSTEDIDQLVHMEDPSIKRDQIMLENISKYVLMNRECSVLVRRELFRLILKVFCRRCHMAHMILFVDRILKNEIDTDIIMNHIDSEKSRHSSHRTNNQFYLKYWIMILNLRESEPHLSIRKAAAHYVNIICKNVDNLKNKGTLPVTPSVYDFSTLLQMNTTQRPSLQKSPSIFSFAATAGELNSPCDSPTDVSNLPLISTRLPLVPTPNVTPTNLPLVSSGTTTPVGIPRVPSTPTGLQRVPSGTGMRHHPSRGTTPISHHHTPRSAVSIIPPAISTSPSFGNLQLIQESTSQESQSHIDQWLEMQLSLIGLPATFTEWCINTFVQYPNTSQPSEMYTREERVNELSEYKQIQTSLQYKSIKPVVLKDSFSTNKAKLSCLSFHPYYSMLAVGMNNSIMLYDYQEQKQIYSIDDKLNTTATAIEWINPSSASLLVEATRKGTVYIWRVPPIEKRKTPYMVSSFLAFPVFAKQQSQEKKNVVVMDWNQEAGQLAAAGTTQLVKVWDMEQERLLCCKDTGFSSPVVTVKSSSEFVYYCCLANGKLALMDTRCKEVLHPFSCAITPESTFVNMTVLNDSNLAIGQLDGKAMVIDPRVFKATTTFQLPTYLSSIHAHPILPVMAASSLQSEVTICNLDGSIYQSIQSRGGFRAASLGHVKSVVYHPLDNCLATYNSDGIVCVYKFSVYCKHNHNKIH